MVASETDMPQTAFEKSRRLRITGPGAPLTVEACLERTRHDYGGTF